MAFYFHKKYIGFDRGIGSADLKFEIENGIVKSVGQNTENKLSESISAITSLVAAAKVTNIPLDPKPLCQPYAKFYPLENGGLGKDVLSIEYK